jgi:hypothetical protein
MVEPAGILFRLRRNSHLAPFMALGFVRHKNVRRDILVSTLIPRPLRGRVFDPIDSIKNEKRPTRGRLSFLVVDHGTEPASVIRAR